MTSLLKHFKLVIILMSACAGIDGPANAQQPPTGVSSDDCFSTAMSENAPLSNNSGTGCRTQETGSVNAKVVGQFPTGLAIQSVSLSYGVSSADLDLASAAGAKELEKRINDLALAACKEVGRQHPKADPSDAECAKAAAKKAMVKAREMILAAVTASSAGVQVSSTSPR